MSACHSSSGSAQTGLERAASHRHLAFHGMEMIGDGCLQSLSAAFREHKGFLGLDIRVLAPPPSSPSLH